MLYSSMFNEKTQSTDLVSCPNIIPEVQCICLFFLCISTTPRLMSKAVKQQAKPFNNLPTYQQDELMPRRTMSGNALNSTYCWQYWRKTMRLALCHPIIVRNEPRMKIDNAFVFDGFASFLVALSGCCFQNLRGTIIRYLRQLLESQSFAVT